MKSRKRLLLSTNLYLIANITGCKQTNRVYRRVQKALETGIKILQLRCKVTEDCVFLELAQRFRRLAKKNNALFIVNDRVDIAFTCDADGVHLGQDDLPLVYARNILGKDKIIGKSTHNLRQALLAQSEQADYIGFGPIFKTQTKSGVNAIGADKIRLLLGKVKIPIFVLGGINRNNIEEVISSGAERVAVSNAILSKKDIKQAVKNLQNFLADKLKN